MKTYAIPAAAELICGTDCGMKDPAGWVVRQIKAGRFTARKIGRHYRMTDEQVAAAIALCEQRAPANDGGTSAPADPVAPEPDAFGLTPMGRRRLQRRSA